MIDENSLNCDVHQDVCDIGRKNENKERIELSCITVEFGLKPIYYWRWDCYGILPKLTG